jgi:hypothetical protein
MANLRKRLLAATSVTVATGTLVLSGLTAASAAVPAAAATEHFQIMTTSATSSRSTIVATGLFTGGGVDISGHKTDTVRFPAGTFKITHRTSRGSQHFNPRSCLLSISLRGTFRLGSGTGKYAGLTGHGTYRLTIVGIAARNANGTCSQKKPPVAYEQTIVAHGPAHL